MDDFNSVCSDLIRHLKLSSEIDGKIYWYNRTPELLLKMVRFLLPESERYNAEIGRLKKRVVYRGDVFNAIEAARINALDGILTDRYKDGFHDGLKRALEILANEVQDVSTSIPADDPKEE